MSKTSRSIRNQYRGINAHLHSHFQAHGGWSEFHAAHINDLLRLMRAQLLPMGYTAGLEQSLQIRRQGEPVRRPEADVTIYDTLGQRDPAIASTSASVASSAPLVLPLPEVLTLQDDIAPYRTVVIYDLDPNTAQRGEPVAWLELLSPSNKPGGADAAYYRHKRRDLIQTGLVFVEIDYLHSSAPTIDRLPPYRLHNQAFDANGHAYRIIVIDPRPDYEAGQLMLYGLGVEQPIPIVTIPLNAGDVLAFDFDRAYQKTFTETLFGLEWVDYAQLPSQFDHYRRDDQTRIVCRMVATLQAAQRGEDLETAVIDPPALELDDALHRLNQLQAAL